MALCVSGWEPRKGDQLSLFDRSSRGFGEMVRAIYGVRDGVRNVLWGGSGSVIGGTGTQACGKYLTLALKGLIYGHRP